jgi:N-acetylmuramoyl-L-alanine amidase
MTGKKILKIARTKLGQKYILGALAPKDDADWNGPWDCAEYCAWAVYQATERLFGCIDNTVSPAKADAYTGAYARDAKKYAKIISVDQAAKIPGALVLRVPYTGKIGHVVFSDGLGETAEAHSANRGTTTGMISGRRWDYGILIPWVEYSTGKPVVVTPPKKIYRNIRPMMKGKAITLIQEALKENKFNPGKIDGVFGDMTEAAVRLFQNVLGLLIDGEVGPETINALDLNGKV